jgi:hypothetical protein
LRTESQIIVFKTIVFAVVALIVEPGTATALPSNGKLTLRA